MNYIYDVLLNFQKEYYAFYEWNNNDKIIHIRKIPIFYITNKDFKILKFSIVKFDKTFLYKILNKTEKFKKANVFSLKYAFIISNGKEALALKLNKNGISSYKSSLLLDEEEEVADIAYNLNLINLNYNIIKSSNETFETRKEKNIRKSIVKKLDKIYTNKEEDKLKFLYLDCFNKKEKNINKIFNCLKKEALNNSNNYCKIYDFFKIAK